MNIPIVCSGLSIVGTIYIRVKKTNNLLTWTLEQAEDTIKAVTENPAIQLLETPLSTIDRVVCKSLDVVENRIPSINLPPKMLYWNTKEYITDVSTKIVKPVLKRADSMKQIGSTVLVSKYTEYAADKLEDALDYADAYIEKYLPDQDDQKFSKYDGISSPKALHTIHHADRVSRKLQRRLTKRTLEHAKIIKEQSTEAIHVLLYVAELIVTDPKLALQKTRELWEELSKDEPENQARPKNVEEMFVLLVRELARKMVHFMNYSKLKAQKVPRVAVKATGQTSIIITETIETIVKKFSFNLDEVKNLIVDAVDVQTQIIKFILQEFASFISKVLEQASQFEQPEQVQQRQTTSLTVPKVDTNLRAISKGNNNSNHYNNSSNNSNGDQPESRDQEDSSDHQRGLENGKYVANHSESESSEQSQEDIL